LLLPNRDEYFASSLELEIKKKKKKEKKSLYSSILITSAIFKYFGPGTTSMLSYFYLGFFLGVGQ
jgi:hypothetical protein